MFGAYFPNAEIILCADDDLATEGNPGLTKATVAAIAVAGRLAVPDFGNERPDGVTDFNDMAAVCGPEAVARAIANAKKVSRAAENSAGAKWPEPQPLTTKLDPEPYPLDALPDEIQAAVIEVEAFIKAPIPLVASSALGAL